MDNYFENKEVLYRVLNAETPCGVEINGTI